MIDFVDKLRLMRIESTNTITPKDRIDLPGVHFCPDFDLLAIYDKCPEKEACTCKIPKPETTKNA